MSIAMVTGQDKRGIKVGANASHVWNETRPDKTKDESRVSTLQSLGAKKKIKLVKSAQKCFISAEGTSWKGRGSHL